jgi:XTP/dITP diphosphohydrolase
LGRIVLLVTSPRLPVGLLTAAAWDLVRSESVLAAGESDLATAIRVAGGSVTVIPPRVDQVLEAVREHGTVVWLASPGGDEAFARELGLRLAGQPGLAELELMYGSWDPAGARLLDAVAVMDRLISPGGDPWLRQAADAGAHGAHRTLARYLLEEAYEAYDAIEAHDLDALRDELGDVLLQVVLHARLAEEADEPWSVDDVAGALVDKLVRRNPHVFAGTTVENVEEITRNWESIKRREKPGDSAVDGIPLAQPALALAAKILTRARRAGLDVPVPGHPPAEVRDGDALGRALLALVAAAEDRGLDAEGALRRAALAHADAVRAAESRPG